MPIVGETILGFFDVFDAIFTIRDVVQHGDIAALGFLAFDLLVPVIGDAVMSIRRSAKGMSNWSDNLSDFMRKTDNPTLFSSRNIPTGDPKWDKPLKELYDDYDDLAKRTPSPELEQWIADVQASGGSFKVVDDVTELDLPNGKPVSPTADAVIIIENGKPVVYIDAKTPWIALQHELRHVKQINVMNNVGNLKIPKSQIPFLEAAMELDVRSWEARLPRLEGLNATPEFRDYVQKRIDEFSSVLEKQVYQDLLDTDENFAALIDIINKSDFD